MLVSHEEAVSKNDLGSECGGIRRQAPVSLPFVGSRLSLLVDELMKWKRQPNTHIEAPPPQPPSLHAWKMHKGANATEMKSVGQMCYLIVL